MNTTTMDSLSNRNRPPMATSTGAATELVRAVKLGAIHRELKQAKRRKQQQQYQQQQQQQQQQKLQQPMLRSQSSNITSCPISPARRARAVTARVKDEMLERVQSRKQRRAANRATAAAAAAAAAAATTGTHTTTSSSTLSNTHNNTPSTSGLSLEARLLAINGGGSGGVNRRTASPGRGRNTLRSPVRRRNSLSSQGSQSAASSCCSSVRSSLSNKSPSGSRRKRAMQRCHSPCKSPTSSRMLLKREASSSCRSPGRNADGGRVPLIPMLSQMSANTTSTTTSKEKLGTDSLKNIQDHKTLIAEMRPSRRKIKWDNAVVIDFHPPTLSQHTSSGSGGNGNGGGGGNHPPRAAPVVRIPSLNLGDLRLHGGLPLTRNLLNQKDADNNSGDQSDDNNNKDPAQLSVDDLERKIRRVWKTIRRVTKETTKLDAAVLLQQEENKTMRKELIALPMPNKRVSLRQSLSQLSNTKTVLEQRLQQVEEQITYIEWQRVTVEQECAALEAELTARLTNACQSEEPTISTPQGPNQAGNNGDEVYDEPLHDDSVSKPLVNESARTVLTEDDDIASMVSTSASNSMDDEHQSYFDATTAAAASLHRYCLQSMEVMRSTRQLQQYPADLDVDSPTTAATTTTQNHQHSNNNNNNANSNKSGGGKPPLSAVSRHSTSTVPIFLSDDVVVICDPAHSPLPASDAHGDCVVPSQRNLFLHRQSATPAAA